MKFKKFIYPYTLWMFIFIIVPMVLIAVFAFTDTAGRFTVQNIIGVGKYSGVFLRSIAMGALATAICVALGYPFAYIISKISSNKRTIAIMLIIMPMWMNFLLRTYSWMTILENNGIINNLLRIIGLGPFQMINTAGAVVMGMVYNFLPFMVFPIYSSIIKIDKNIIEAAEDLGASRRVVFLKVMLPLSLPGVMSGITMVFVPSVSTFIISKMLGGGTNILIGDVIDMQFLGNAYNPHLGSAISLVLMVLILICIGIMNQFDSNENEGRIVM